MDIRGVFYKWYNNGDEVRKRVVDRLFNSCPTIYFSKAGKVKEFKYKNQRYV